MSERSFYTQISQRIYIVLAYLFREKNRSINQKHVCTIGLKTKDVNSMNVSLIQTDYPNCFVSSTACENCVHKQCIDDVHEQCSKKKNRPTSTFKKPPPGMYLLTISKPQFPVYDTIYSLCPPLSLQKIVQLQNYRQWWVQKQWQDSCQYVMTVFKLS